MYFPDYYDTEIKCTTRYSKYPLFLFTLAFDGPTFPEIDRIVEKFGSFDKTFTDKKVLFARLSCIERINVNDKYKFKLSLDKNEKKLFLEVYDKEDNFVEKESFVYFESMKNHLTLKLNFLALVYASQKKMNKDKYFRYYKMCLYKLISFEKFLSLLESGVINVSLISRVSKSGADQGRYRNKNLVFEIRKDQIKRLFTPIYFCDYDEYGDSSFTIL